mgnify:CR=1 FL=1
MITTINEWKIYESNNILSADEIINYIKIISDNPVTDIPDYYLNLIKKSNSTFKLKRLNIQSILNSDESLKEYVDANENRYEDEEYEPHWEELDNPIVIYNNKVIDGYNRTSVKYNSGETEILAYVSQ